MVHAPSAPVAGAMTRSNWIGVSRQSPNKYIAYYDSPVDNNRVTIGIYGSGYEAAKARFFHLIEKVPERVRRMIESDFAPDMEDHAAIEAIRTYFPIYYPEGEMGYAPPTRLPMNYYNKFDDRGEPYTRIHQATERYNNSMRKKIEKRAELYRQTPMMPAEEPVTYTGPIGNINSYSGGKRRRASATRKGRRSSARRRSSATRRRSA